MTTIRIGDDDIRAYREDGIACLRGVFSEDEVALLRAAAERSLTAPSEMTIEIAETRKKPGRYFFDTFVWRQDPALAGFLSGSGAAEIAGRLMGSAKINLFFDQWLIKEPGTDIETPWHHDMPYWPVDGHQVCSMWIALDPVTEGTGAVEYIKGSHLWGRRFSPSTFSGTVDFGDRFEPLPDIEAERDRHEIVRYELQPGDCTVHHGLLVHHAPGNTSRTTRRRAYVVRWAGDDAVFDPRPDVQHMPDYPDIAARGPLDSDLWPVVWRRSEAT